MSLVPEITIQYYKKKRKKKSGTRKILQQSVSKIPFFFMVNLITIYFNKFLRNGEQNGKKEKGVF